KTITGQLIEIWHGNAEGDPYCDEYGHEIVFENGTIETDIKDNAVTLEFVFFMFGSKYTNKIVLKEVLTG
ncbi:MAG: hypothetical protein LBG22_05325, partial [Treponema sp.]|nr:hypothetical protein [Treponema sp.]